MKLRQGCDKQDERILADHEKRHPNVYPTLVRGGYYYRKSRKETVRFDGWAMQLWESGSVCWDDVGSLDDLEEVTWGTPRIPLQDFSDCEHY